MGKKILVIPDTQCKPGINMSHLTHIGKYIVDKKPDVVIHLGDHWDMHSLSSYDKGKRCVDKDTEYLSLNGWKKISEYKLGDFVGVYDNLGYLRFEQPKNYIVNDAVEDFLSIKTSRVSMQVTTDHRLIYVDQKKNLVELTASSFKNQHETLVGGHTGRFITTFKYQSSGLGIPEALLRLIVAFKADGSQCGDVKRRNLNSKFVHKFHFKRKDKIERIRQLIKNAGLDYKEVNSKQEGFVDFYTHIYGANKRYDFDYSTISIKDASIIIDEMLNWDGCRKKNSFSSIHKCDADFIQYCFALLGQRASVRVEDNSKGYGNGLIYRVHGTNQSLPGVHAGTKPKPEIVHAPCVDGKSYCFTVSTGMWISRRDGHIVVTGNCFEGRRYKADIEAGNLGMQMLLEPLVKLNKKKMVYKPTMHFLHGNHENRILRATNDDPMLDGTIGLHDLDTSGWITHPFLEVFVYSGIAFSHYFTTGVMGRPCTTAAAQLSKKHMSCVAGHQQGLQIATAMRADGAQLTSLIVGSCYNHIEDYLGPQGNTHFRGVVVLNDVKPNGQFEVMPLTLRYLKEKYK